MINISSNIVIYRPARMIFDFISSVANNFEWQYGTLGSAPTSDAGLGVGSTFATIGHMMGRRVRGTYEVTAFDAGRRFGFRSLSGPLHQDTLYTLDMERGRTRVRAATQASAVNWLDVSERVMERFMQKQLREDLTLLKEILEARSKVASAPASRGAMPPA